jgi:hypothetical protein
MESESRTWPPDFVSRPPVRDANEANFARVEL